MKWLREFNKNKEDYYLSFNFNQQGGCGGYFSGIYIPHVKFYRYDGTLPSYSKDDYRAKRGFLIAYHYSERDVVNVQMITDNLVEFLKQEGIEHSRKNFKRKV